MTVAQYRENLLGERVAVEALLDLFTRRGVHATWATVGALFCGTKKELLEAMPDRRPRYVDAALSPYSALNEIGEDEGSDPFHFAPSLVAKIAQTAGQELATHTFAHFYCLEAGQSQEDFDADLAAAARVGAAYGDVTRSLVFPRNQFNPEYRATMQRRGVRTYRSNGTHWAYAPATSIEPRRKRAFRLADAYAPLSGPRTHRIAAADEFGLVDVPASAFLRPYTPRFRSLDRFRFQRLTRAMSHAAALGECFHLWWHPHNFGRNLRENMVFLEGLLDHLDCLRRRDRMVSASMIDAAGFAR
jgi:peptidoglycan/xylan/chitin deacetylase (PgdA/CDA1 family)